MPELGDFIDAMYNEDYERAEIYQILNSNKVIAICEDGDGFVADTYNQCVKKLRKWGYVF